MQIFLADQLRVTLLSILLGLGLGALYDIVRIFRTLLGVVYVNRFTDKLKSIKLPLIKNPLLRERKKRRIAENIMIFITDILYFLTVTFVMIIYVYYVNSGIVRWYIFAGAIFGMLTYYVFVGKLVISVSECIAFFLKVVFLYLAFFISRPFLLLYRKIKPYFQKIKSIKKNNKKSVEKIEKHRCQLYKMGKYEF